MSAPKPWDARLARWLIRPLAGTRVTPGHLTTLRLLVGLAAVTGFAAGTRTGAWWGAWLFALSNLLDHTDGELARLTGRSTRAGHVYDLASDGLIHVLLFVGIGLGLQSGPLGGRALPMGIAAGGSVAAIFLLRAEMERRHGKEETRLPAAAAFEIEDVLYLMPLVVALDGLRTFLWAAAVGAPGFLLWLLWTYRPGRG